jgi:hypothetical protein
MTNPLKRGEVWLADLNPTQGSEQAGIRLSSFSKMTLFLSSQRRPLLFPLPPINAALLCLYAY